MKFLRLYLVLFTLLVSYGVNGQNSFSVPEGSLESQSIETLWNKANTAYANDNYIGAERIYNEILNRDVHSAALYYNLGNVHHKRSELGLSLLYYYRALRMSPSDDDILHNIEVVKAKTTDQIDSVPKIFIAEWSDYIGSLLSCIEWSVLSVVLLALALSAILLYLLTDSLRLRRIGFGAALVLGLIFVVATRHALISRSELMNPNSAIVMSSALSVTSSPSKGATELFILHEGTKVEVLTRHNEWSEIKINDGKKGWVDSRKIEII